MVVESKEMFLKQFDRLDRLRPTPMFQPLRQAARARFHALPFPTPHTEDWRFTSVTPLLQTPFEMAHEAGKLDVALLPPLPTADTIRLTFVNGWFAASLSALPKIAGGVAVGNLASATPEQARQL